MTRRPPIAEPAIWAAWTARDSLGLGAAGLAAVLAIAFIVLADARSAQTWIPVIKALGCGWLIVLAPTVLRHLPLYSIAQVRHHVPDRRSRACWVGRQARVCCAADSPLRSKVDLVIGRLCIGDAAKQLLVISAVAVLALAANRLFPQATPTLGWLVAGLGAGCAVATVHRFWAARVDQPHPTLASIAGAGALFAAIATFCAGFAWGCGYQHPRFFDHIAAGTAHLDTLFHGALAHMVAVHGLPSTGLDGTPQVFYHFGSHWWMAQLAHLVGATPLEFYQFGFQVLAIPWIIQQIIGLSLDLRAIRGHGQLRLPTGPWFWLVAAAAWTGITVPYVRRFAWASANLVISESHALATGLLLAGAAVLLHWFAPASAERRANTALHGPAWPQPMVVKAALFVPVAVLTLGLVKISHMAVVCGLMGYLWWRLGLWRSALATVGLVATALAGWVAVRLTSSADSSGGIVAFDFFRNWVLRGDQWPQWLVQTALFIGSHYALTLALVLVRWRQLRGFSQLFRGTATLDVELAVVAAIGASLPGLILAIDGGGAYYFSDIQRWLSLVLLLSVLPTPQLSAPMLYQPRPRTPWSSRSALAALVLLVGYNTYEGADRLYHCNDTAPPADADRRDVIARLRTLAALPVAERRQAAIWVPRDVSAYWRMLPTLAAPLTAPAIAGLAHIDGLPIGDHRRAHYGYNAYPARPTDAHLSQADAVQRAAQLGYQTLFVFEGTATRQVATPLHSGQAR
ncbi:MAG: hypothetical protein EXR77_08055 [Myxococcales bacterium]|nr:hypothetical protein [Myxococcales bacterium]